MIKRWMLFPVDGDVRIHLEGAIGDSYTLCGMDTAGDDRLYTKHPSEFSENAIVTCEHCLEVIALVKKHLKEKK